MHEPLQASAAESIDADPFELEWHIRSQHGLHAGDDALRAALRLGVGVPAELQVDAPDVIRLFVQQGGLVAVERRVEPEPALGRELGPHHHVGDQEAVAEGFADEWQAEAAPHEAARAIGGQQPLRGQRIGTGWHLDRDGCSVGPACHHRDRVPPAQIHEPGRLARLDQPLLGVVLLQVDEGRVLVPILRQQIEIEKLPLAAKHPADVPGDALGQHAGTQAQPAEDLERALGETDRPAAGADGVVVVQHHDPHAALREVEGQGQPDQPAAHHHRRVMRCALRRRWHGVAGGDMRHQASAVGAGAPCSNARHISMSRSAVQMRG